MTAESRSQLAKIERETKRYPSDLTDEEWAAMEPLIPVRPGPADNAAPTFARS